jgi:hypothetical protein
MQEINKIADIQSKILSKRMFASQYHSGLEANALMPC